LIPFPIFGYFQYFMSSYSLLRSERGLNKLGVIFTLLSWQRKQIRRLSLWFCARTIINLFGLDLFINSHCASCLWIGVDVYIISYMYWYGCNTAKSLLRAGAFAELVNFYWIFSCYRMVEVYYYITILFLELNKSSKSQDSLPTISSLLLNSTEFLKHKTGPL
jgi:hypothetical protein